MTITLTREEAHQLLVALQELNRLSVGENAICLPAEIDDAMEVLEARLAQPESEQKQMIEPQLSPKARAAVREAYSALVKWQTICLQKNRSAKELTIPTNAIFTLIKLMEVEGLEQ
jgi:hypothetical protein